MKNFSLKALCAFIFAAGLVIAGVAAPAQAATLSPSATATGVIGTTGTNASPITFTVTAVTGGADEIQIMLPSGWTFVNPPGFGFGSGCGWFTVTGYSPDICRGEDNGGIILKGPALISASTTIVVVVPANTFNVGIGRSFAVRTTTFTTTIVNIDSGTATLASGSSSYTAAFNPNGGSGSMADQTASAATALTEMSSRVPVTPSRDGTQPQMVQELLMRILLPSPSLQVRIFTPSGLQPWQTQALTDFPTSQLEECSLLRV